MITNRKTQNSLFMADFAASDRRSVHAHIAGTSIRAHAFSILEWTLRTFRIQADSEAVFRQAGQFLYKRRKGIARGRQFVTTWTVRVSGLIAGVMLFSYFMKT